MICGGVVLRGFAIPDTAAFNAVNLKKNSVVIHYVTWLKNMAGFSHQESRNRCVTFRLRQR